jgi:hypothetical protein
MNWDDLWEDGREFRSFADYERFRSALNEAISLGKVEEVIVGRKIMDREQWVRHPARDEIWRMIEPDAPYHGYWGPVRYYHDLRRRGELQRSSTWPEL